MRVSLYLVLITIISGCTSYSAGNMRDKYNPVPYDIIDEQKTVLIKAAEGLNIWGIDGVKKVSTMDLWFGSGLDSVLLSEGEHKISGVVDKVNLHLPKFEYISNHEYFFNYVLKKNSDRKEVKYWLKDLTNNVVVLGKEVTIEELKSLD